MPRYIVKLTDPATSIDYYMEWSTIVDAPVTYGMSLEEFKTYYKEEYGNQGMEGLDKRLERVEANGTSAQIDSYESFFNFNHAGENESPLNFEEILEQYCINKTA